MADRPRATKVTLSMLVAEVRPDQTDGQDSPPTVVTYS